MTALLDRFSRTFVGIEFKKDSLSIVCLQNNLTGLTLISSYIFPLREDDELLEEIKIFISRSVISPKDVFVSIPYNWSIIKFIDVPSPKGKGKDALINMMRFEIERHIPFPMEDVSFDFQVVEKKETVYRVIFAAIQKEKIDYVKGFLEKISLQPKVITLSPFAMLNSIEFSETTVGGWQNLLGLTKKPDILGRKDLICSSLFIDNDDAHFAVLRDGFCIHHNSFTLNQSNPLDVIVDNIIAEITVLPPHLSHEKINKLILSGNTTSLPGLADTLSAKLGTSVQTINPAAKFFVNDENMARPELAPLVGLCYSGLEIGSFRINLLPHKPGVALRRTGAHITKISIPLVLFLIISIFAGETINDKRLLIKIEKKIKENEPELKFIENLSRDINLIEKQTKLLTDSKNNNGVLTILSDLSKIIPSDAWLSNFHYREKPGKEKDALSGELQISGYAESSSVLISILEDSPFFEGVEFVGPITKRMGKDGFKIKTVITGSAFSQGMPGYRIKNKGTKRRRSVKSQ